MRNDDFLSQQFIWFTGQIEVIEDPEKYNRVKVRCHGYHPKDSKECSTNDLPWATVMMPNTSAGLPNIGANHHLEIGSWVVGFFRDGPSCQDPVVMGSITTSTDGTADLHSSASISNKIYRSESGHLIEINNGTKTAAVPAVEAADAVTNEETGEIITPAVEAVDAIPASRSGETIQITHAKGAKITIDDENNITITNSGTTNITTTKDISLTSSTGNVTVTSGPGQKTRII